MIDIESVIKQIDERCEHYNKMIVQSKGRAGTESHVAMLQGCINSLTSLRDFLVDRRKKLIDSITPDTLQEGVKYRVTYRLNNQRFDRVMVGLFMGTSPGLSFEALAFSLRPAGGTNIIPKSCIKQVEPARPGEHPFVGRRYET